MISVYGIHNTVTDKWYVGSSANTKQRWQEHRRTLKQNKHHNAKLQNAYNKYGKDAFEYHILANYSSDTQLEQYEMLWTIALDALNNGYVLRAGMRNGKFSNETRKKMSEAAIARGPRPVTEETKEKIRNTMTGVRHSEERKQNISKAQKGKKNSEESRKKVSESLKRAYAEGKRKPLKVFLGKKHSEETRKKISEATRGKTKAETK